MTNTLQKILTRLEDLPTDTQERIARRFLETLETELRDVPSSERDDTISFDQIAHFAGLGEGPADLSTNKAYLSDLGKPKR